MALAAIDMALWDALARSRTSRWSRLLGGVGSPFRAYGAVGYDGAVRSAQVAEAWATRGFTGVKAKIGYPTRRRGRRGDPRHAQTPPATAWPSWSTTTSASRPPKPCSRLRVLDDEGLTWVEEPTLAHDFAGHALIAREAPTPIQCGENWWGALDLQHAIDARGVRLHHARRDEDRRRHRLAARGGAGRRPRGIRLSNHLWPEISAQLLSRDADGALAGVRGLVESGRRKSR